MRPLVTAIILGALSGPALAGGFGAGLADAHRGYSVTSPTPSPTVPAYPRTRDIVIDGKNYVLRESHTGRLSIEDDRGNTFICTRRRNGDLHCD